MSKTIGVIGCCGSIGRRHFKNLLDLGCHALGYDPALLDDGPSIGKVIDQSDAIIIASPTATHIKYLIECADKGKPVFVEKPVANKKIDVNAVMVGYNLRFHSCVKKAKEWLPEIGTPLWANFTVAQYSAKRDYLSDGVILNWSHEIDLALYLLGPADVVSCAAGTLEDKGHDVIADIILLHTVGCQSVVHLDYLTKPEVRQSIIVGSKATIIMDLVNRQAWLRASNGEILDHHEGYDTWDENYMEEMQAFLDRCDGKTTIGCTGVEGLDVLNICLQARKLGGL